MCFIHHKEELKTPIDTMGVYFFNKKVPIVQALAPNITWVVGGSLGLSLTTLFMDVYYYAFIVATVQQIFIRKTNHYPDPDPMDIFRFLF